MDREVSDVPVGKCRGLTAAAPPALYTRVHKWSGSRSGSGGGAAADAAADLGEQARDSRAKGPDREDDDDGDEGNHEAVLDHGCAALVADLGKTGVESDEPCWT